MTAAGPWRSVLDHASTYRRALLLVWTAAPRDSLLMALMLLFQGITPPLSVWLVREIVDALSARADPSRAALMVALWAAVALVGQFVAQWVWLVQANLNERVTAYVELLLVRKANSLPDLTSFEDPAFYDDLRILSSVAPWRPMNLMVTTAILIPGVIASVGLLGLLASLAWWIPLTLIGVALFLSYANMRVEVQSWRAFEEGNPIFRAMRYFVSVVTSAALAKEIRLFDAGSYFETRYQREFERLRQQTTRARRKQAGTPLVAVLLFVGTSAAALWWTVSGALSGRLSLGDVVLLIQALGALQAQLTNVARMASVLLGHLLFFAKLFSFLAYRSPMRVLEPGVTVPRPLSHGIAFDRVTYRYPTGTLALDDVSIEIRPGERLALVGENGAGKTTLVKLLCRLYDPSGGSIRVDGVDLRDLDLAAWRRRISAVFQDFGRYQLTTRENIALGDLESLAEPHRIERAAHDSGFITHARNLANGLDTRLGVEFGGADLSGGQWQSLAVARALLRGADVLVLDEPTASLDPRAEYELFSRFAELSRGKATLLVTHRLGSVRMADRILVLKQGRLVETGTHDELLRLGGEYAALYRLQAEQYASL